MEKINCVHLHTAAPIPQNGVFAAAKEITDINGFSHGVGTCAPQQGACKISLNVEKGIIIEALVEVIGCSGMTQSATMAAEILVGKTLLEALNTDLVCDAINVAMRNIFLQLVYGRSQSAYTDGGLPEGSAYEDLGALGQSAVGTSYNSVKGGVRYLNTSDGYITSLALDKNDEVIGYQYIQLPLLYKALVDGSYTSVDALLHTYGRYDDGVKHIDPRHMEE